MFTADDLSGLASLLAVLEEKTGCQFGPRRRNTLADILRMPHNALRSLEPAYFSRLNKDDLMLAFPVALFLMNTWSERHGGDLELVHDESAVMMRKLGEWTDTVSPSVPEAFVGMDRRTWRFPIGVKSTRFEKDQNWIGLQVADVIAGSLAATLPFFWQLKKNPDNFEQRLLTTLDGWPLDNHISPDWKFTPAELGTEGPVYADPIAFWQNLHARNVNGK
jgi:hypothetical protein